MAKLTGLPNIGKAIAADLMSIGIVSPHDLEGGDPLKIFSDLAVRMGDRDDPCVYYMLLSVKHFLAAGLNIAQRTATVAERIPPVCHRL